MPFTPRDDAPIVLARDLRFVLVEALDRGDYSLARHCIDVIERVMRGDRTAIDEAKTLKKEQR